jgi:hypothetical protein
MHKLVAMVQGTGRYPSRSAVDPEERAVAVWLQRRGKDAWAGTLAARVRPSYPAGKENRGSRRTRSGGANSWRR